MTSNGLLRITIKLVGLALLVNGAVDATSTIPLMFGFMSEYELDLPYQDLLLSSVVPLVFGLLFWLVPSAIANTIIKKDLTTQETEQLLNGIELIAIRVLGIFLLYQGLSELLGTYLSYRQELLLQLDVPGYQFTFMVIAFEVMLAVCLILGAQGIKNIIWKVRQVF